MKPIERTITLLLRSRAGSYTLVGFGVLAMLIAASAAKLPSLSSGRGLVTGLASADFISAPMSLFGALALVGATMVMMSLINSTFNLLRSSSLIFIGVYAFMEAASPIVSTRLGWGSIVAVTVLAAMGLLYSVYQQPVKGSKRVFMAFCLLSAGSMFQYAFLAFLPIFMAGCMQMRCMSARTFLAALVGIAVPWWIAWGFGAINLSDIALPQGLNIFSQLDVSDKAQLVAVMITTVVAGLALTLTNMVKIYSYNARSRSFTGLLVTVTFATLLMTMVDFANITAYLPLLNVCVAFQAALSFRINAENRGYIPIVTLLSLYLILYIWSIII